MAFFVRVVSTITRYATGKSSDFEYMTGVGAKEQNGKLVIQLINEHSGKVAEAVGWSDNFCLLNDYRREVAVLTEKVSRILINMGTGKGMMAFFQASWGPICCFTVLIF